MSASWVATLVAMLGALAMAAPSAAHAQSRPWPGQPSTGLLEPAPDSQNDEGGRVDSKYGEAPWGRVIGVGSHLEFSSPAFNALAHFTLGTHRLFGDSTDARLQIVAGAQVPLLTSTIVVGWPSASRRHDTEQQIDRLSIGALLGATIFDDRGRDGQFDFAALSLKAALLNEPIWGPQFTNTISFEFRTTIPDNWRRREILTDVDAIFDWRLSWGPFLLLFPFRGHFSVGLGVGPTEFSRTQFRWDIWFSLSDPAEQYVHSKRATVDIPRPMIALFVGVECEWRFAQQAGVANRARSEFILGVETSDGPFAELHFRINGDVPFDFALTLGWRFS